MRRSKVFGTWRRRVAVCGILAALVALFGPNLWAREEGPIKVAWLVITPTSAVTGPGLVASVNFGESRGDFQIETGILASNLSDRAMLIVDVSGKFKKNLGIAFANPGPSPVSITMTLADSNGALIGVSQTITLGPFKQTSRFITEFFSRDLIQRDFLGTLMLTASGPVSLAALRFAGENFTATPLVDLRTANFTMQTRNGVGGAGAIVIPIFAVSGGFRSELNITNPTDAAISGRVDFFDPEGQPMQLTLNGMTASTFQFTVPSRGVFVLAPRGRGEEEEVKFRREIVLRPTGVDPDAEGKAKIEFEIEDGNAKQQFEVEVEKLARQNMFGIFVEIAGAGFRQFGSLVTNNDGKAKVKFRCPVNDSSDRNLCVFLMGKEDVRDFRRVEIRTGAGQVVLQGSFQ